MQELIWLKEKEEKENMNNTQNYIIIFLIINQNAYDTFSGA